MDGQRNDGRTRLNRDFSLPATPGRARILRKLAAISGMFFDPKLEAMAETGLAKIGNDFADDEKAAIQSILDHGMRCIMPGPMIRSFEMVAEAAKIDGIKKIIVLTPNKNWWLDRASMVKSIGIEMIIKQAHRSDITDSDFIREHRDQLVVFDASIHNSEFQRLFAHSFPKAIALSNDIGMHHLIPIINVLFPNAPAELLGANFMSRRKFEAKGFTAFKPVDFAFLLNIVIDHLDRDAHDLRVKSVIFDQGDEDEDVF